MFARFARVVAATIAVGLVVGGVIGGIGGRLAMRVLVLTSDDSLKGVLTDDDEIVGRFTLGGTLGLIIFLALGGAAVALAYLVVRRWLSESRPLRAGVYALLFFGVQGSDMFDPDGIDFTVLEPHWLAVLMFVAILLGVGWLTVVGVEWALERWPQPTMRTAYAYVPLLLRAPAFPVLLPIAIAGGIAYLIQTNERVRHVWESRALTVMGQLVIAAILVLTCVPTIGRIGEILS